MIEVGQQIFCVESGRQQKPKRLIPATVIRVGRVNYEVQDDAIAWRQIVFRKKSNLDVGPNQCDGHHYRAYLTEQDYRDEQEYDRLFAQLRDCFEWRIKETFSLEQLREACRVLKLEVNDSEGGNGSSP